MGTVRHILSTCVKIKITSITRDIVNLPTKHAHTPGVQQDALCPLSCRIPRKVSQPALVTSNSNRFLSTRKGTRLGHTRFFLQDMGNGARNTLYSARTVKHGRTTAALHSMAIPQGHSRARSTTGRGSINTTRK